MCVEKEVLVCWQCKPHGSSGIGSMGAGRCCPKGIRALVVFLHYQRGELLATSVVPAFDSSLAGASNSWGSFSCMSQITVSHSTRHDLPWLIHF